MASTNYLPTLGRTGRARRLHSRLSDASAQASRVQAFDERVVLKLAASQSELPVSKVARPSDVRTLIMRTDGKGIRPQRAQMKLAPLEIWWQGDGSIDTEKSEPFIFVLAFKHELSTGGVGPQTKHVMANYLLLLRIDS